MYHYPKQFKKPPLLSVSGERGRKNARNNSSVKMNNEKKWHEAWTHEVREDAWE